MWSASAAGSERWRLRAHETNILCDSLWRSLCNAAFQSGRRINDGLYQWALMLGRGGAGVNLRIAALLRSVTRRMGSSSSQSLRTSICAWEAAQFAIRCQARRRGWAADPTSRSAHLSRHAAGPGTFRRALSSAPRAFRPTRLALAQGAGSRSPRGKAGRRAGHGLRAPNHAPGAGAVGSDAGTASDA
jgi:hypothetical protein